jgi:UDP-glucose 4-epimerase
MKLKNKIISITGGCDFIGSNLICTLYILVFARENAIKKIILASCSIYCKTPSLITRAEKEMTFKPTYSLTE